MDSHWGILGRAQLRDKGLFIMNKVPRIKQFQVPEGPKLLGENPRWCPIPSPAYASSVCLLLPGSGTAGPFTGWKRLPNGITSSGIRALFLFFLIPWKIFTAQPQSWGDLAQGCLKPVQGFADGVAKLPLEAALVGFPFQVLLWKTLKSMRKRHFLMTESPDSLGEPGAQPMGASWRGSPLPMAHQWARTSPKNTVSTWDDEDVKDNFHSSQHLPRGSIVPLTPPTASREDVPLSTLYLTAEPDKVGPTESVSCIQHLPSLITTGSLYWCLWKPWQPWMLDNLVTGAAEGGEGRQNDLVFRACLFFCLPSYC